MSAIDLLQARQIRHRAAHFQNAILGPRRQAIFANRVHRLRGRIKVAVLANQTRRHLCVGENLLSGIAFLLNLAC